MWSGAGPADLKKAFRPRSLYSSKRENGRVVIIGGSERFHGAPILSGLAGYSTLAALRVGIGYAITCVPKYDLKVVMGISPNLIVRPLGGDSLQPKDFKMLKDECSKAAAVAIGGGINRRSKQSLKTAALIVRYCIRAGKRVVVDADALYAIGQMGKLGKNVIITPNQREFSLFFKDRLNERNLKQRVDAALMVSRKLGCIVVLKGHATVVTDGSRVKVVKSRTSTLATMGTGDILSGMVAGFAALNDDAFIVATAGAYTLSLVGDLMYKEKGNHGIASDLVGLIPKVLKQFDKNVK
ncbi:MAG: NAD(P)H-hydrate dehydratase [Candidatus Micrarchaeota archaeon]|nr:NAD(P)H-hydrate dehydratase [Candidatus Micrarchaeota archaeon]MDE1848212.1 NAD(P)H-hydrate dehydratase [Candidatus Micrarchaeota archaeon]MDE1864860.1 NAD(P)H-hydrate dehydratase [Candidatus Micrarchaeota archaeon]